MTIEATKQSLTPGARVELFDLDFTPNGGPIFNFIPSKDGTGPTVTWRSNVYSPFVIKASGFMVSSTGAPPRPVLSVSNVTLLISTMLNDIGDPLRSVVTRWVTFSRHLDGAAEADPDAHFLPEVYYISRVKSKTRKFVDFELSSILDQEGERLPRWRMTRTCSHVYRRWNPLTNDFSYTAATCPYAEEVYFKEDGTSTPSNLEDSCGKRVSDCKLRYGTQPLPFKGYPSLGRIR